MVAAALQPKQSGTNIFRVADTPANRFYHLNKIPAVSVNFLFPGLFVKKLRPYADFVGIIVYTVIAVADCAVITDDFQTFANVAVFDGMRAAPTAW